MLRARIAFPEKPGSVSRTRVVARNTRNSGSQDLMMFSELHQHHTHTPGAQTCPQALTHTDRKLRCSDLLAPSHCTITASAGLLSFLLGVLSACFGNIAFACSTTWPTPAALQVLTASDSMTFCYLLFLTFACYTLNKPAYSKTKSMRVVNHSVSESIPDQMAC